MSQLVLELPQKLHDDLESVAGNEGISVTQFVIDAVSQNVALAKLMQQQADLCITSVEEMTAQFEGFSALLKRLGPPASDDEVARFLASRTSSEPESDLDPRAAQLWQERIAAIANE